jgi:hypothetical protein
VPPPARTLPTRAFQRVALITLPLPFAATWFALPYLPQPAAGSDFAIGLRALAAALALLVFVLVWAVALLPLRRRSALPPIAKALSGASLTSVGAAYAQARRDLHADASAPDATSRRRYHRRMAAAGALVTLAAGAVTAVMLTPPSTTVLLWFPVATAVGAALTLYHLARALLR